MKLFIESVFDKTTNKLEDAKQKAIEAANKVEEKHGNLGAGKIYYFATAIDKLIVAIGKIAKQATGVNSQILTIKDIPEIKLGDIPTKFAKYQELVIPTVDLDTKKVIFTRIKDMNGEENLGASFKVVEIPNNNPVYDFHDYKVEIINEQPKFVKVEPTDLIEGTISFIVGAFGTVGEKDRIQIMINGEPVEIEVNTMSENTYDSNTAKVISNESEFFVKVKKIEFEANTLNEQHPKYRYHKLARVFVSGFFYKPVNISILGKTDSDFDNEAFGYIQKSLEVENVKPFTIPAPYTDVATKIDGVANHSVVIKKDKPFTDGITMGALMSYKNFPNWGDLLKISDKDNNNVIVLHRKSNSDHFCYSLGKGQDFDLELKVPETNKPFYAQMSLNFKTKTLVFTINGKSQTVELTADIDPSKYNIIIFGDTAHNSDINFISDMWYWIGDTADITEG